MSALPASARFSSPARREVSLCDRCVLGEEPPLRHLEQVRLLLTERIGRPSAQFPEELNRQRTRWGPSNDAG
jgi:hypothetical protein